MPNHLKDKLLLKGYIMLIFIYNVVFICYDYVTNFDVIFGQSRQIHIFILYNFRNGFDSVCYLNQNNDKNKDFFIYSAGWLADLRLFIR